MPRGAAEAGAGAGPGAVAGRASCERAQAQEREQRVEHGEHRQRSEGARGVGERQSARRLPEQHRHVPAQRQDRAPDLRKSVHAQHRKSHAGVAECGRDHEAGEAEAGREVAHQELHQRSQRQVADDQQRACSHHHRHVALERNPEQSFQDERHRQHDDEEDQRTGAQACPRAQRSGCHPHRRARCACCAGGTRSRPRSRRQAR